MLLYERGALAVAEVEGVVHVGGVEGGGGGEGGVVRGGALVLQPVVRGPGLRRARQAGQQAGIRLVHAAVARCHLEVG